MRLDVAGLTVRYRSGGRPLTAVDGVDFSVASGETLGLVGESGCGKSSIARALVGLVPIAAGRVLLDGEDRTSASARNAKRFRRQVQMVFQDPYASLNPRMTVEEMLTEAIGLHRDIPRPGRRGEAQRILGLVGLPANVLERYPHQFSGGQRQRIAIARALAVEPSILILDEVTSALDVSVQGTILNLLRDLQRGLGLSYLYISHDLSAVRYMSDLIAVMYLGRVVETAATFSLFESPRHPYTRGLIASVPQVGMAPQKAPVTGDLPDPRDPPRGCRFHTRCPIGPRAFPERVICVDQDPQAGAVDRPHNAACHFAAEATAARAVVAV